MNTAQVLQQFSAWLQGHFSQPTTQQYVSHVHYVLRRVTEEELADGIVIDSLINSRPTSTRTPARSAWRHFLEFTATQTTLTVAGVGQRRNSEAMVTLAGTPFSVLAAAYALSTVTTEGVIRKLVWQQAGPGGRLHFRADATHASADVCFALNALAAWVPKRTSNSFLLPQSPNNPSSLPLPSLRLWIAAGYGAWNLDDIMQQRGSAMVRETWLLPQTYTTVGEIQVARSELPLGHAKPSARESSRGARPQISPPPTPSPPAPATPHGPGSSLLLSADEAQALRKRLDAARQNAATGGYAAAPAQRLLDRYARGEMMLLPEDDPANRAARPLAEG